MSRVLYDRPLSAVGFRPYRHTTPFSAAHGLGSLGIAFGTDSTGTIRILTAAGSKDYSSTAEVPGTGQTVSELRNVGYSDSDIATIVAQYWQDPSLYAAGGGSPAPVPSPAQAAAAAAGVPSGSVVTYQGTWQTTTTKSANDILNAVLAALPKDGINVLNSSSTAGILANTKLLYFAESGQNFQVTLRLQPIGDYGQPRDIASIVDHEVWVATGTMPQGSGAAVTSAPGAAGSGLPSGTDFTTWLEENALWIALGVGAIFILPKVLK